MTALRQQMVDDMVLRGLSAKTQEAYLRAVTRLAAFYGRSPVRISEREIQRYLLHLYREKGFSHSTCNVTVAGLRFFYHVTLHRRSTGFFIPAAREPRKLPEILTREELTRLFSCTIRPKHRALLLTAYAAGLRVSKNKETGGRARFRSTGRALGSRIPWVRVRGYVARMHARLLLRTFRAIA